MLPWCWIISPQTAHFAVVWFWTTKFFQTSLRIRDMKDRQRRQRVKTVRQSASWVPFSVIKFWKLKAFSVSSELCTLRLWLPFAMQVIIHPDWPVLNWQPMRAEQRESKQSRVWHLIRIIATFNSDNCHLSTTFRKETCSGIMLCTVVVDDPIIVNNKSIAWKNEEKSINRQQL